MCKRVFEHLDDDKNGYLEPQEIKTFLLREYQKEKNKMSKLFSHMPDAEMRQTVAEFDAKWMRQLDLETDHYMQEMDTNKDGHVSREEFLNFHLKRAGFEEENVADSSKIQQEF
jgi:Ca2+-binding EF-hand superfamily protein